MSSVVALADSSQRGQSAYDAREIPILDDYNVVLPPYGYSPSFWGYGGRRYYDRFGNYKKYGQEPGEPDTGPVESEAAALRLASNSRGGAKEQPSSSFVILPQPEA